MEEDQSLTPSTPVISEDNLESFGSELPPGVESEAAAIEGLDQKSNEKDNDYSGNRKLLSALRIVEILLGSIALVSGGLAVYYRKVSHHVK
jgi:hypothetical protein